MTKTFNYRPETRPNPFTGFTSFQHFRGGKLYEDIVVRPENHMTETERVECYPVSADAGETCEGYYPAGAVAYIRILWKEFEPVQGEYNYAFIEQILADARAAGQVVMLRLMAHSTRWQDDVPEWLKALIPCPERPDMKRVKDSPTDPAFLRLFGEAIRALGERFDPDPTLWSVDISLPGSWGEGYKLELYPKEDIQRLTDLYLSVFPHTRLYCQAAATWLVDKVRVSHTVGIRGDGFGSPHHIQKAYPEAFAALPADFWKTSPVSFESYWWLGEWERQGWDIDEIIEKSLGWHISSFNGKSMPIPEKWRGKVEYWLSRMGYHFHIAEVTRKGGALTVTVENRGVAPIYEPLPLALRFTRADGTQTVTVTETDVRKLLPGKTELRFAVPADATAIALRIGDERQNVCFCTEIEQSADGWAILCAAPQELDIEALDQVVGGSVPTVPDVTGDIPNTGFRPSRPQESPGNIILNS